MTNININNLKLAHKVYTELTDLYKTGCREIPQYFTVVKNYVNLQYHPNKNNSIWELDGKTYSMYHTFSSKYQDISFNQFLEDVTMMIYRLNGGTEYNTITLIDFLASEEYLEILDDYLQGQSENGRNEVYWI